MADNIGKRSMLSLAVGASLVLCAPAAAVVTYLIYSDDHNLYDHNIAIRAMVAMEGFDCTAPIKGQKFPFFVDERTGPQKLLFASNEAVYGSVTINGIEQVPQKEAGNIGREFGKIAVRLSGITNDGRPITSLTFWNSRTCGTLHS